MMDQEKKKPAAAQPQASRTGRIDAVTLFTFGLIALCILGAIVICVALIYSSRAM